MYASFFIARRELKSFFGTAMGWISACLIFLVSGVIFAIILRELLERGSSINPNAEILSTINTYINFINIFIVPAFTMKVMTEDLATGNFRLLAASPISSWAVVWGKFLGILSYFALLGLALLIYPLYTIIFSEPDLQVIATSWLGFILGTGTIISIALFVASLTKNQVLSYLGSAFFILIGIYSSYFPHVPEWYRKHMNILELANEFSLGLVKTDSLVLFFACILGFLLLTRFSLESKKWRV